MLGFKPASDSAIAVDNTTTKAYSVKFGRVKNKRTAIDAERRVKISRAGWPHAKRRRTGVAPAGDASRALVSNLNAASDRRTTAVDAL